MTATTPPAHRRARPPRALRVLVAAATIAGAVLAGGLTTGASAAVGGTVAAEATPTPTPTDAAAAVTATLVPDSAGRYAVDSPLNATLTIRNAGTTPLADGAARLELGRTALADRAGVLAWLAGEDSADLVQVSSAAVEEVAAGESASTALTAAAQAVGSLASGVYPLRAAYAADGTTVSARSVIVVPQASTASVAAIVPITATPASGFLLGVEELTALTAADGALTAQLDAVAGTGAILAIDPLIPAAIRALGSVAPASAQDWLGRLDNLPNERFALQPADADTAAQAAAGLSEPLGLTTLDPLLNPQDFAEATGPGATPSPSQTPGEVSLPGYAALTNLGRATSGVLWPRGDVSADDIASLGRYNEDVDAAAVPILPSTSFTAGGAAAPLSGAGTVGEMPVLVTDAAVSDALSRASDAGDAAVRGAALAEAAALVSFADPASTVVAGLHRDETRDEAGLRAAVSTFAGIPDVSLAALTDAAPVALDVASTTDAVRADGVAQLLEDEQRIAQFATILADPGQLTVRQRLTTLRVLAVGSGPDDASFTETLVGARAAARATLDAVGLQPANPILISANVDVPVWLRNDLPYPVSVRLHAEPSDARIDVRTVTDVEAQASTTTRLTVPIESRIASGEVDLALSLTSPTGVAIGSPQVAKLTVRAEWEGIGLIVLGGITVLLIGGGIIRTVLRRRRTPADEAEAEEPPGAEAHAAQDASVTREDT